MFLPNILTLLVAYTVLVKHCDRKLIWVHIFYCTLFSVYLCDNPMTTVQNTAHFDEVTNDRTLPFQYPILNMCQFSQLYIVVSISSQHPILLVAYAEMVNFSNSKLTWMFAFDCILYGIYLYDKSITVYNIACFNKPKTHRMLQH